MNIIEMNGYQCTCSCCTGSGCTLNTMGIISVSTCASTTCLDNCRLNYPTCSIGLINAVCQGKHLFDFHSIFILMFSLFVLLLFKEYR